MSDKRNVEAVPDLDNLWQYFDTLQKDVVFHLFFMPQPVSLDDLVSLSVAPITTVLNAVEELREKNVLHEEKTHGRGFYFLSPGNASTFENYLLSINEIQIKAKQIINYLIRTGRNDEPGRIALAELYRRFGMPGEGSAILMSAADIVARAGQYEKALAYYDHLFRGFEGPINSKEKAEDFALTALARTALAIYHAPVQNHLPLLMKARTAARRYGLWSSLARIEMALSQLYQTAGQHKTASRYLASFTKLSIKIDDSEILKSATLSACEVFLWKGRLLDVVRHYEKIVGSLEEFGDDDPTLEAGALVGFCFVLCGRVSRGMGMIHGVCAKANHLGLRRASSFADLIMALSLLEVRRVDEAVPLLEKLRTCPEDILDHLMFRGIYDCEAYIHCARGEFKKADQYCRKSSDHARALGWKHNPCAWTLEFLSVLESKGFINNERTYDSEISILLDWDNLYMRGAALRYRALRNMERDRPLANILVDLKTSEKCLKQAGAEIELARTWIALGRYYMGISDSSAGSYLEKAWAVFSRIDVNLFPKDLVVFMSEERRLKIMIERMMRINESLGSLKDQAGFLERVIEVAMDFASATRGSFITLSANGLPKITVSRNLDPSLLNSEKFKQIREIIGRAACSDMELVIPPPADDDFESQHRLRISENLFQQAGIRSLIGMPVKLSGERHGYLYLDNPLGDVSFSHSQIPFVRFLGSQIAVGLANLETYETMRELKSRFEEEAIFYKREMGVAVPIDTIVGKSRETKMIIDAIRQVAPTDSSVLVTGETGVGKELVAKAIHNLSNRKEGPFIPVNLAAIPQELVASELFGHEKGAFTGANENRKGRFELAHGGTIFLDEVGDLPLTVQVKLLRVLQESAFERLGNSRSIQSDFRVIAATNKDLITEVEKGTFRQDLYYRLAVFPIHVPPLRDRREDIPELSRHFVEKLERKLGKRIKRIPNEEMDKLIHYTWPGNVRELEHSIEKALILSVGNRISFPDFDDVSRAVPSGNELGVMSMRDMEREYILRILNITKGKVMGPGGAASILDMKPTTLFSRMKKLGIQKPRPS